MAVYVDNYRAPFGRLRLSHMIADTEAELDEMADRIGLKREWKQRSRSGYLHYDIGETKRGLAIRYGVNVVTCHELIRIVRDAQR